MLRVSLLFIFLAIVALFNCDISIKDTEVLLVLSRIWEGAVNPDFSILTEPVIIKSIFNTLKFAILGTATGALFGLLFAFFFEYKIIRYIATFLRSIHELFWAILILNVFGICEITAIISIAIPFSGIFAKVYSEIMEESDQKAIDAISPNASTISRYVFGVLPISAKAIIDYTKYRFECALRSSAVLGFVGLPTIGYYLEIFFGEIHYSKAMVLLYLFIFIVATLRFWLKPKTFFACYIIALFSFSWQTKFSWEYVKGFIFDIIPAPLKKVDLMTGAQSVHWDFSKFWNWASHIFTTEAWPGIVNTILITQVTVVLTGLLTIMFFPFGSNRLANFPVRYSFRFIFIILRTIPEYIMTFILIILMGPSMLPAILTISIHNGSILSHLCVGYSENVQTKIDSAKGKVNLFFFEILPSIYSQFLAFLFYRWEVMTRESAMLGYLGIQSIGFYILLAKQNLKLDKAFFLIIISSGMVICIDLLSQIIRKKLQLNSSITTIEN